MIFQLNKNSNVVNKDRKQWLNWPMYFVKMYTKRKLLTFKSEHVIEWKKWKHNKEKPKR